MESKTLLHIFPIQPDQHTGAKDQNGSQQHPPRSPNVRQAALAGGGNISGQGSHLVSEEPLEPIPPRSAHGTWIRVHNTANSIPFLRNT